MSEHKRTTERLQPPGASGVLSILLAALLGSLAPRVPATPDEWDSRLDDLGVYLEECDPPEGTWYWRLVSARYEDEQQAAGTHHVFFRTLDENGTPLEGQKVFQAWPTDAPTNTAWAETKGPIDDYWGNLALFGGWCPFWPEGGHGPYGAYVDGVSDAVWGMGLPCNRHVSFRLVWQWTLSPETPAEPVFVRGDADENGTVDISDAIRVLTHLFVEPMEVQCEDALDSNDDGTVDITDPIATLGFLFLGGEPLLPVCGPDPTGDAIGCDSYAGCPPL